MSNGDYSRSTFDPTRNYSGVLMQQGRIQLDADWNELVEIVDHRFRLQAADTVGHCVVPRLTTPEAFRISEIGHGQFRIGRGRIYVDGLLAENHGPSGGQRTGRALRPKPNGVEQGTPYREQPYLRNPPALPAEPPFLVYIDVWQREVTYLDDPNLIEKAVGVDTTVRRQTVWQVRTHPMKESATRQSLDDLDFWQNLTRPSAGRLSTRMPENDDYRGAENRLYRVEIHSVDTQTGQITVKWSRDNASTATAVKRIGDKNKLIVRSLGRGATPLFQPGDWVEVTDDGREFEFPRKAGEMHRIENVRLSEGEITLSAELNPQLIPSGNGEDTCENRHTRIHRWDQGMIQMKADEDWVTLDSDGVQIQWTLDPDIPGGQFHVGDYWLFTARTVDRTIERLRKAAPLGIQHHYGCLGFASGAETVEDWRDQWPPPPAQGQLPAFVQFVTAESHNSGHLTIQSAIQAVGELGGTVFLGPGRFTLEQPVQIKGTRSLRIIGQGWNTRLEPAASLAAGIIISESAGIRLEEFNLSPPNATGAHTAIQVKNSSEITVQHCSLCLPDEAEGRKSPSSRAPFWSTGVAISGRLFNVILQDNFLIAKRCLGPVPAGPTGQGAQARDQKEPPLRSGRLLLRGNVLIARLAGSRFHRIRQKLGVWWWQRRHWRKA